MPLIEAFRCEHCDFHLPSGWGGYVYAIDDAGVRHLCPHPMEFSTVEKLTGLNLADARAAGRAGFAEHCVCLDCLAQFDLDPNRDARLCCGCGGGRVATAREMVGRDCPECRKGKIERCPPSRAKRNPVLESLPTPEIVKAVFEFCDNYGIRDVPQPAPPAALAPALEAFLRAEPSLSFFEKEPPPVRSWLELRFVLHEVTQLFRWGEQVEYGHGREQLLRRALDCSPELAAVVEIRGQGCCYRDEISAEQRTAISYLAQRDYSRAPIT